MKKTFGLVVILLSFFMPFMQTTSADYGYSYDTAGNRKQIIRKNVQLKELKQEEEIFTNYTIKIAPNPTVDFLKISLEGINNGNRINIELFSIDGNKLYSSNQSKPEQSIDFTDKASGVYLLNIYVDDKASFWRIIKE
jgi:hypothetical protein